MAIQITLNGTTYTPTVVTGYTADREPQTVVNLVINRANPDVALRPAGLRTGTLECAFMGAPAESQSKALADAVSGAFIGQLTVTAPDPLTVAMYFVTSGGRIGRELEDQTRNAWIVRVPFQEVTLS